MTCLLNPVGCLLDALPWWTPWAAGACLLLILGGALWRLVALARAVAGNAGVAGALGLIVTGFGVVVSLFRRRPAPVRTEDQYPDPGMPQPRRPPAITEDDAEDGQPKWWRP